MPCSRSFAILQKRILATSGVAKEPILLRLCQNLATDRGRILAKSGPRGRPGRSPKSADPLCEGVPACVAMLAGSFKSFKSPLPRGFPLLTSPLRGQVSGQSRGGPPQNLFRGPEGSSGAILGSGTLTRGGPGDVGLRLAAESSQNFSLLQFFVAGTTALSTSRAETTSKFKCSNRPSRRKMYKTITKPMVFVYF